MKGEKEMTPFRIHVGFGLVLLIIGITFDFLFVQSKASEAFRTDPMALIYF